MFSMLGLILGLSNLFCGGVCWALGIPLRDGKIAPNHWYGMRFKKSFASEELWYKINSYGATKMIFWSKVVIGAGIAAVFLPLQNLPVMAMIIGCTPLLLVVGGLQCLWYANQLPDPPATDLNSDS